MLIVLPDHLRVSGITTWAMHAIRGLRERSIPSGIIVHTKEGESVPEFLEPYVVANLENATSIQRLHGSLDELVPLYLETIKKFHAITGQPVLVSPNLHGDCYGAIAMIAQEHPELVRVAAWIHSDNEYDIAVAKRYEPMIHAIVPVSRELCEIVQRVIPSRAADVFHIPYCVEVYQEQHRREPREGRPLRLVYTGRLDEHQKRVSSLPLLARNMKEAGLDFEFRIVGDGPLMEDLSEATAMIEEITLVGSVPPDRVRSHLQWGDVWVLPSRYEGQSVAMLEALSEGCVPIVTQVRSGSQDAVIDGKTGLCVESEWNTPIEVVAERISDAILSLPSRGMDQMAHNAHELALQNHSVPIHIDAIEKLMMHVQAMPAHRWPSDIRASYSAKDLELDGSTPPDASKRMSQLLASLKGKRVLIYCSGQHTKDISAVFEASPVEVIGIIDDDPSKIGTGLIGYPIFTPEMIPDLGATELVISSWIYEDTIWARREEFELFGVRLHRLYPVEESRTSLLARMGK